MELCKPTIIVIAYNRDAALKRLLDSLNKAVYPSNDIRLVISIDNGGNPKVYDVAEKFDWLFGEKVILKHPDRLGLKKHVLSCGNLCERYGSIIMLEDDLCVSPAFYSYAQNALSFSRSDSKIAGISLYNHLLNVHAREPFEAVNDGYDNWYFQFASSWGQAFTNEQWAGFVKALDNYSDADVANLNVPVNVSSWSEKSWLKFYIKYMIDNNLYFIYPRVSLTTNFSDEGTHADSVSDDLQVAMYISSKTNWNFSSINESSSVYDAFFENRGIAKIVAKDLNILEDKILVDLYGYKVLTKAYNEHTEFIVTSASLPYLIKKSYGRHLKPIDANIISDLSGDDLFVYDLKTEGVAPKIDISKKLLYNYKAFKAKYGVQIILRRLQKR